MATRNGNGDAPIGPESGHDELEQRIEPHEFQTMSDSDKLDRLVSLYFGIVHKLEDTRRWVANHELEYKDSVRKVTQRLDYIVACQTVLMHKLGVDMPPRKGSEPPDEGGDPGESH